MIKITELWILLGAFLGLLLTVSFFQDTQYRWTILIPLIIIGIIFIWWTIKWAKSVKRRNDEVRNRKG